MMLGATEFLPKPLVIEELIASVSRAIEANRPPSLSASSNNEERASP